MNDLTDVPKIGKFWIYIKDGKITVFYCKSFSLDLGQIYGSFIVDPEGHYNLWESLRQYGLIPKNSNYEDLPRGRVSYNKDENKYIVYHGNYIKSSPDIKPVIKAEFNLKQNTEWVHDLHYDKYKRWGF